MLKMNMMIRDAEVKRLEEEQHKHEEFLKKRKVVMSNRSFMLSCFTANIKMPCTQNPRKRKNSCCIILMWCLCQILIHAYIPYTQKMHPSMTHKKGTFPSSCRACPLFMRKSTGSTNIFWIP